MRTCIVHEWLASYAGSERVLEQMLLTLPDADIYCVLDALSPEERGFLRGRPVKSSFIQRLPFALSRHRYYLPLMPLAVEQFDLSGYDLVISSSHAVAKGVLTGPDQLHICMCYSPIRYAWDLQHQYLSEAGLTSGIKSVLARLMLHYMRQWDARTANGVDCFIAISEFIARRIWKVYHRPSTVIYPPVDIERFQPGTTKESFYVTASRVVPYKRVEMIVEAFSQMPGRQLVVIGDGSDGRKVVAKAGSNIKLMGSQSFDVLRDYMQRARGFVFAAEEDFGIVTVEAQACGTPVIAYGRGGSTETVIDGQTGVFFHEQSIQSLVAAIDSFEKMQFDPRRIRRHAERFSGDRFREEFTRLVSNELDKFRSSSERKSV